MLSSIRVAAHRSAIFSSASVKAIGSSATARMQGSYRMLSNISDDLARKEKVEEDRYIRQKEHEAYVQRKAKEDAVRMSAIEAEAKAERDPVIHEIFTILSKTDDKISDVGIETLANWKLGRLSV